MFPLQVTVEQNDENDEREETTQKCFCSLTVTCTSMSVFVQCMTYVDVLDEEAENLYNITTMWLRSHTHFLTTLKTLDAQNLPPILIA